MSYPASQSAWTTTYNNTCTTKASRTACSTASTTCNNQEIKNNATVARKKADVMCESDGLAFYRRIYSESANCVGNNTATTLANSNRQTCKNQHERTITESMTDTQKCNLLNATRMCDRNYVGDMCGDLFRWMIDAMWMTYLEVFYKNCRTSNTIKKFDKDEEEDDDVDDDDDDYDDDDDDEDGDDEDKEEEKDLL
ncbi:hypothetical protein ElyMa_003286100 [Elysia marginata]|uniref:Uncharacterized protein n=1 Tax=Elysia marginata TaxID=1093978 RepID=A0AAV4JCA0_9GAST|nr:hypothetical protein ElyMa_003286100 [Elysia marginata]